LLEAASVGGREIVRRALAEVLTPDLGAPNATVTHEALLTLGNSRAGRTRLITTNFDRLFEEVIATKALSIERFQAPLLPVPKNRWDGLVYLHGLLTVLHAIGPKSLDSISPAITESLGRLCVAAHDVFPNALERLRGWLQPLAGPYYLVHRLCAAGLCARFELIGLNSTGLNSTGLNSTG